MDPSSLRVRHPLVRELLIFLAFVLLTAIITWPWVLQLRNGVSDAGDPYSISYFIWWNYHQTFRDPLNLFHATIFYPYRYSLAFGEYDYGVSLLFFPLFAIGFRPLTVYSVAAFLSFPFTAYGTFRLARTLSGSSRVAWVAGIALAFVPFRFHHLAHLHLIFAGWIPLLFEALVLYARARTWKRACWLGFTFLMNALTCTTWLIITAIPLALSGLMLATRYQLWRERRFWVRGAITLVFATLLLLPFLLPYRQVAKLNSFSRSPAEVAKYSATPMHWLAVDERNKLWRGLGSSVSETEMVLFPGLFAPLLALAAVLLAKPLNKTENLPRSRKRLLLIWLDFTAVSCGVLALLALGYEGFRLRPFGYTVLSVTDTSRCLFLLFVALIARSLIVYPSSIQRLMGGDANLIQTIRERSEIMVHGLVWLTIGFIGSFGLNFFFHRVLYDFVPGFQSMRVASRWAMIAYFGMALLAGVGAVRFSSLFARFRSGSAKIAYALILAAIVFELNVAPLKLIRGEVYPDALTQFLQSQNMIGGIIELPAGERNNLYMLRAADHGKPLVNAHDSFVSPLSLEVERLTRSEPIPKRFMDLLEETPVSYLTVHNAFVAGEERGALEAFLAKGIRAGRLRFIKSFTDGPNESQRKDVYAVTKTEPNALSTGETAPAFLNAKPTTGSLPDDVKPPDYSLMLLYKLAYGRWPLYADFKGLKGLEDSNPLHGIRSELPQLIASNDFVSAYGQRNDEQFLDGLLANAGLSGSDERDELLAALRAGTMTRTEVLRIVAEDRRFIARDGNSAFILFHYFLYFNRDADEGGYKFWLQKLNETGDYKGVSEALKASAR